MREKKSHGKTKVISATNALLSWSDNKKREEEPWKEKRLLLLIFFEFFHEEDPETMVKRVKMFLGGFGAVRSTCLVVC